MEQNKQIQIIVEQKQSKISELEESLIISQNESINAKANQALIQDLQKQLEKQKQRASSRLQNINKLLDHISKTETYQSNL